jgi:hypothetical protein
MVLHVLIGSDCLSVDVYMVVLGGITQILHFLIVSFHLRWVLLLFDRQNCKALKFEYYCFYTLFQPRNLAL